MRGSCLLHCTNLFHRSVGASIIDYHDFVFVLCGAQCIGEFTEQLVDVSRFIERRVRPGQNCFQETPGIIQGLAFGNA